MTEKKGDDHLDEIRTVLWRHASGRSDDTTFHHDDHAQTKKPEASSGRRPKKDPNAENRSTSEILHAAGQRAEGFRAQRPCLSRYLSGNVAS